jgi:multicomponent Na+:H+ antiporter subunit G
VKETVVSVLVVAALVVMTLGVVGLARLGTVRLRLHAASKIGAVGVVLLALASALGDAGPRALIAALFVLVTAPVSSHVLASAAPDDEDDDG